MFPRIVLFVGDVLSILGSLCLAAFLRFGPYFYQVRNFRTTLAFLLLFTLFVFYFDDLYNTKRYVDRTRFFFKLVRAYVLIGCAYMIVGYLSKWSILIDSRIAVALYEGFFLIFLLVFRLFVIWKCLTIYYGPPHRRTKAAVLASGARLRLLIDFLKEEPVLGLHPVSSQSKEKKDNVGCDDPDELFVWSEAGDWGSLYEEIKGALQRAQKLNVASKLFDRLNFKGEWIRLDDTPVLEFTRKNPGFASVAAKRFIDLSGALLGLVILSPVMILTALVIKLDSKGPVLFKQIRLGENSTPFPFLKFRSMTEREDTEERAVHFKNFVNNAHVQEIKGEKTTKVVNQSRLTRVGRIIRKVSLDELPQLFNVLRGQMSLVGPRPPIPYEVGEYKDWHKDRLTVKSGLTGLWQIYGRSRLPFDASVFLDLYYVINRSVFLDLKLIFKTIPYVVLGIGGY